MSISEVLKQGFLVKKGHVRHNWRTRWFVLTKCSLSYFRKREDTAAAGVISLVGATLGCPPTESGKKPWLLQVSTQEGKDFLIQAPDQTVHEEWKHAIEECIRKLDPSKMGTNESLTRTVSNMDRIESQKEVVQAMQDPMAGVKLLEFRAKGANQSTRYFNGKEAVGWLVSWSFASSRPEGVTLASSMLRHGFFHPIKIQEGKGINVVKDPLLNKEFVDSEYAFYVFVMFSPGQVMDIFDSESDSDSEDDLLSSRMHTIIQDSIDMTDGRILKQGFLLKKGDVRHNWKPRKFVLREKASYLYYYRGSKIEKPLGGIPLEGLSIMEQDNETDKDLNQSTSKSFYKRSRTKANRIVLITPSGGRYCLEAIDAEERDSWVSQLRIASQLLARTTRQAAT